MKRSIFTLIALSILSSAGAMAQPKEDFPFVTVPHYIADDWDSKAEWVALHFWDKYDFSACEKRYDEATNKRGFATFISTLYATTPQHSFKAIEAMMTKAASNEEGYWYFLEMAEEALYDPNSTIRNDLLWEQFVRHAVGEKSPIDEPSKERYRSLLSLVSRNQQGAVAHDFTYTLADGRQGTLHTISAPYTVLFFYNPDCGECARTKAEIVATGYLEILHSVGALEVLALYPNGDIEEWRKALPNNPQWWISAYDKRQKINSEGLYDLKAFPTLYLLDSQKRVLMKDPTVETFLGALERILMEN